MMFKFVLLSTARSGTSLLIEMLRHHPDALVHGEVFHERVDWHLRPCFLEKNDISERSKYPLVFVDTILDQSFGKSTVGFKMWRSQNSSACEYILHNEEIIKIILRRENLLAQYSSDLLAEKTRVWNLLNSEPVQRTRSYKVMFSCKDFFEFVTWQQDTFAYYLSEVRGSMIYLTYKDLCAGNYTTVFSAVGLDAAGIRPQTKKLHSSNILSRFVLSSQQAVQQTMANMNKLEWLYE